MVGRSPDFPLWLCVFAMALLVGLLVFITSAHGETPPVPGDYKPPFPQCEPPKCAYAANAPVPGPSYQFLVRIVKSDKPIPVVIHTVRRAPVPAVED